MSKDEPKTTNVSLEETKSGNQPEESTTWFTGNFRSNFKHVFAHLLNEEPPQETGPVHKQPEVQRSKEQFCIQWCSQTRSQTEQSTGPDCRMWCVRRVEEETNWNPFSGIHLYSVHGFNKCQEQIEGQCFAKMDTPQQPATWTRASYHLDIGEKSEQFKEEAVRIVKKTFGPGYEWGRRYLMSWQDGTQARFFDRFTTSIKQGDGLDLAKKSLSKIMESLRGEK
ncbi:hypothetical protein K493DRAFT_14798 [Basidiobolus meristosporus CBS 931.73]|uniref:Uncharacterized protein n=1 Tax=Basidiobolus meristosporus CBS 931.73 TaxID=1314790 RepID=A0A1Y1YHF4_9FUNG|nr:hypothetical protein K493DRAFT_14798 [Basidiobolus meristosporus CBS 931.73]|eukprot:ORX97313.1 hypothetical protein K493DRAFT_14798 [Basidiobolus meristosporus CBS 931.73]